MPLPALLKTTSLWPGLSSKAPSDSPTVGKPVAGETPAPAVGRVSEHSAVQRDIPGVGQLVATTRPRDHLEQGPLADK